MRRANAYTIGQLLNVWLCGALCGVTLYACIRHAAITEQENAWHRLTPRSVRTNTLDTVACFAPVVNNQEMND